MAPRAIGLTARGDDPVEPDGAASRRPHLARRLGEAGPGLGAGRARELGQARLELGWRTLAMLRRLAGGHQRGDEAGRQEPAGHGCAGTAMAMRLRRLLPRAAAAPEALRIEAADAVGEHPVAAFAHPDAAALDAPGPALDAAGGGELAHERRPALGAGAAQAFAEVVGGEAQLAGEALVLPAAAAATPAAAPAAAGATEAAAGDPEQPGAAGIDPERRASPASALPFGADGPAVLPHQGDRGGPGGDAAVGARHAPRGAGDGAVRLGVHSRGPEGCEKGRGRHELASGKGGCRDGAHDGTEGHRHARLSPVRSWHDRVPGWACISSRVCRIVREAAATCLRWAGVIRAKASSSASRIRLIRSVSMAFAVSIARTSRARSTGSCSSAASFSSRAPCSRVAKVLASAFCPASTMMRVVSASSPMRPLGGVAVSAESGAAAATRAGRRNLGSAMTVSNPIGGSPAARCAVVGPPRPS